MSEQPATESPVNIEEIMQQIRQQIIARRAAVGVGAGGSAGAAPVVTGRRYPPEFYEHLYQARLALDEVEVPVFVSKSGVPLIGGLLVFVGLVYLAQSFGNILLPDAKALLTAMGSLGFLEIAFPVWLLIKGVEAQA